MKHNTVPFMMLSESAPGRPYYRQIYESLRDAILSGRLSPGTRLPSSRALAGQLGVSRITVVNAFDQLLAEGYLEGRAGSGTFVASKIPDDLLMIDAPRKIAPADAAERSIARVSAFAKQVLADKAADRPAPSWDAVVPFRNGVTAVREFPFDTWERISVGVIRQARSRFPGYGEAAGYRPLREAIAVHLSGSRGVRCSADQVIITSGAQQALDLITRVLIDPGDRVWIEDPCYQEALAVFRLGGANASAIPVDADGFDPELASGLCPGAKLVYVTPSHQYPTGVTMSLTRRLQLLEWARKNDAWIIEDDYNSEFRYVGRPLASLQNLDRNNRVIYVGTFSKTVFPALRLGCLIVPPALESAFAVVKNLCDTHTTLIEQAVLAEFIAEGHFARHLRRMRSLYEHRQELLVAEVHRNLAGLMTVTKASSGMHLIGWLNDRLDDREVVKIGQAAGLNLAPLSDYSVGRPMPPGLVLGYTGFDETEIRAGIKKLESVLRAIA